MKGVRNVSSMTGIIIGVILIILGLILLITWWSMFIKALMAVIPIFLILIGAGALAYFLSEMKSKREVPQEEKRTEEK